MSDAAAFDGLAARYDELWTNAVTGRLQRQAVWRALAGLFRSGERVADLGCGTGEDAVWLARVGVQVYAVDAAPAMVRIAAARALAEGLGGRITCAAGDIARLKLPGRFDGALSDFGALNTLPDLRPLGRELAAAIPAGGRVALCVMGRFCLWETAWHLLRGQPAKALRRVGGVAPSSLGFPVYYHSARGVEAAMGPAFRLRERYGIGVLAPPSYAETWARRAPRLCDVLAAMDQVVARWPWLRSMGDHELLVFVRR